MYAKKSLNTYAKSRLMCKTPEYTTKNQPLCDYETAAYSRIFSRFSHIRPFYSMQIGTREKERTQEGYSPVRAQPAYIASTGKSLPLQSLTKLYKKCAYIIKKKYYNKTSLDKLTNVIIHA